VARFLPSAGHPCKATFAPAKVRLSQKLRVASVCLYPICFRTLPARTTKTPVLPSPSPLFGEGGGGRRFFKGEACLKQAFRKIRPRRRPASNEAKKEAISMSEETKQEKKPEWWESEAEPMGWKVTEEEMDLALKKLWAGLDW